MIISLPAVTERALSLLSAFTLFMTLPQVFSIWVHHSVAGVSLLSWLSYLIAAIPLADPRRAQTRPVDLSAMHRMDHPRPGHRHRPDRISRAARRGLAPVLKPNQQFDRSIVEGP